MIRSWMRRLFVFVLVFASLAVLRVSGMDARQGIAAPAVLTEPEPGIAPDWLVQRADARLSFSNMSQHSLRLSSSGSPQLVYGGDHLYYANYSLLGWHTQTADGAWNVGSGAALALDVNGKAHISYYDAASSDLKYATNKSGAWQVQTVVSAGYVGRYSDIAIDSYGDPTIVYFDSGNSQLRYIGFDSEYGGWGPDEEVTAGLFDPGHPGWFSFALDTSATPFNRPHISFYQTTGAYAQGSLYYATYSNGWVTTLLDSCSEPSPCHSGEFNSLALDPVSKRPSVAYSYDGVPAPMLIYQFYNGSGWSKEYTGPSTLPKYITLAMDASPTSAAQITYQEDGFYHKRRSGVNTWTDPYAIDPDSSAGEWSSMAMTGILAKVLHYNPQTGQLKFVDHDRFQGWMTPETIAAQGHQVGNCSSLAVDRLGRAHTSYWDESNRSLLYARTNGNGSWTRSAIDISGTASCFSVIAIDPLTNNPVVGLVKGTTLYYATYNAGMETWQSPILVDSAISTALLSYQHIGLAVRSDGTPVFAYIKNNYLTYASKSGQGWAITPVAANATVGRAALALDSSDHPHILFYQASLLKNATNPGSGWVIESLGGSAGDYYGAALAAGPSGQVAAAFLGLYGEDLLYSSRTCNPITQICTWTPAAVADDTCEEYFSLALDARGTPHMACYASISKSDLHYVTRSGSAWVVQAVDTYGTVGMKPALALSPSGRPRISYYDYINADLKFALALDKVYLPVLNR